MSDITLTKEIFEASKILAPAICRGRASLFFDGYGVRKWLSIRGSSKAGKRPCIRIVMEIEFQKTIHQFDLLEYMELKWPDVKELISVLDHEPAWIVLNVSNEKVTSCP